MTESAALPQAPRDHGLDAVKGVLIFLIVIGHLRPLWAIDPYSINALYTFHVSCFLLLPFLRPARALSRQNAASDAVRYLYPFVLFFTLYTVAYQTSIGWPNGAIATLAAYGRGLIVASTRALDPVSNLKLLWFLPALFSLTVVRRFLASRKKARAFFLAFALMAHVAAAWAGFWRYEIPFGLIVVAYLYPLGAVVPSIVAWGERARGRRFLFLAAAVTLFVALRQASERFDLGDLLFFEKEIEFLPLADGLCLMAFASLYLYRAWLARVPFLALVGRQSMAVYLLHPVLLKLCSLGHFPWFAEVILVPCGVLALAWAAEIGFARWPRWRALIFPSSWAELRKGWVG